MLQLSLVVAIATVLTLQEPATLLPALEGIHARHLKAIAQKDIGELVRLDGQLRRLFDDPWRESHTLFDANYFRPEYADLGISVGHYSDALGYSGQLLAEAHHINPLSPYRRYTLYSELVGDGSGYEPPDMALAKRYLREFPRGPFAPDVHLVIAMFNDDLFKFVKGHSRGEPRDHDCYQKFVTKEPLALQMRRAQQTAATHYEEYLRLRPGHRDVVGFLADLREGPLIAGWFYCGD